LNICSVKLYPTIYGRPAHIKCVILILPTGLEIFNKLHYNLFIETASLIMRQR
jgi:hypothetical protein